MDPDIAVHTLSAAGKYMVPALEEPCRKIVIDNLTLETIWEAYTYSVTFGDERLREGCHEYFRNSVTVVENALELPSFLKIPNCVLLDFLQINDSNADLPWEEDKLGIFVSEKDLFMACNLWAAAECKRQSIEVSGPNKRKVLGDCLFLIRFPSMAGSDITNIVAPTEILNKNEKRDVLAVGEKKAVQNKFLSTKQRFPVIVSGEMLERLDGAAWGMVFIEGDPPNRRPVRSMIQIIPRKRVMLFQVWLIPRYYMCIPYTSGPQCSRHEVVVKSKNKIRSKQSVVAQSIKSGCIESGRNIRMLVLDLEPVVLDIDCPHTIRVHEKEWDESDSQLSLTKESFAVLFSKIRQPKAIHLEVSDQESNKWIGGVVLSLL